jgi:DNA-binding GntR family transcriptional regulator
MTTKSEATYVDLRERIMFGELKGGAPYSASDMVADYGIKINMARTLMVAMKMGGYLTRFGPSYVVSTFSHEQVEEWRLALGAIVEISALRMALSTGNWTEVLEDYVDDHVRDVPVDDEDFFHGAMGLLTIVLGGDHSTLSRIVSAYIPQAFFRLLWMSDFYAERTGFLVEACDRCLAAAKARNLADVRAASRHFFDGIAPPLHELIENMGKGVYPQNDRKDGFQTIENQASGQKTDPWSTVTYTPILNPLAASDLTATAI